MTLGIAVRLADDASFGYPAKHGAGDEHGRSHYELRHGVYGIRKSDNRIKEAKESQDDSATLAPTFEPLTPSQAVKDLRADGGEADSGEKKEHHRSALEAHRGLADDDSDEKSNSQNRYGLEQSQTSWHDDLLFWSNACFHL